MNKLLICFVVIFLAGCSAAGIGKTSNPYEKLKQSQQLQSVGLAAPAERLIQGAAEIFIANDDKAGLAKAYWLFGNLYKSSVYHNKRELDEKWGENDGAYKRSTEYFVKASEIFIELEFYVPAGHTYSGAGDSRYVDGDFSEACRFYSLARKMYGIGLLKNEQETEPLKEKLDKLTRSMSCKV